MQERAARIGRRGPLEAAGLAIQPKIARDPRGHGSTARIDGVVGGKLPDRRVALAAPGAADVAGRRVDLEPLERIRGQPLERGTGRGLDDRRPFR